MLAVIDGHTEVVTQLLEAGANIDLQSNKANFHTCTCTCMCGQTVLHVYVWSDLPRITVTITTVTITIESDNNTHMFHYGLSVSDYIHMIFMCRMDVLL